MVTEVLETMHDNLIDLQEITSPNDLEVDDLSLNIDNMDKNHSKVIVKIRNISKTIKGTAIIKDFSLDIR